MVDAAADIHPELLDLVAGRLADGLTVHAPDWTYAYVSPSFEDLSGHAAEDLVGNSPFDLGLVHPRDVFRAVEVQAEALENDEPWRLLYRLQRADGVSVWVESTGRVVTDPVGQHFVVLTRPVEQGEVRH